MHDPWDVAIIGGGPGGATAASMLRRYNPALRVLVLERERFPREHIGESQLPAIGRVLHEIGAWDKVESAGFPIKFGASYTWGSTTDPWEFEFLPLDEIPASFERPCPYEGWRTRTAFQVDRAEYDRILLDHAAELGAEVRQGVRVSGVARDNGRVTGLELDGGGRVEARYYLDASGNAAVLRRALGINVDAPTRLQNIAFWDYWTGATLNEDLFGHGATRIQIRSLPYGWIWYIPLSRTRTSVGLVCPAVYYKQVGRRPEDLYHEAIRSEPSVWKLLGSATPRGRVDATTDWSYVAEKAIGENWFLVGESLGFADPILSAGLTLTHWSARHAACTILELDRGREDPAWLRAEYESQQLKRVRQHIRFAEYWYSANGCFSDVREFCSQIALDSGLKLNAASAFRWLSNGGLDDVPGQAGVGGYNVAAIKQIQHRLTHDGAVTYQIDGKNVFKLNLAGAEQTTIGVVEDGRVHRVPAWRRGPMVLPQTGVYGIVLDALRRHSRIDQLLADIRRQLAGLDDETIIGTQVQQAVVCLEVMAQNYWVTCTHHSAWPALRITNDRESKTIYSTVGGSAARSGGA